MTETRRFCENCGAGVSETTNFCPNCGAAQKPNPEVPPEGGPVRTPHAPGVPPPPEQGFRLSPVSKGVAIVLLIIFLFVACSALLGGRGEESDTTASSKSEDKAEGEQKAAEEKKASDSKQKETKEKQGQGSAVAVGQPVTAGSIEWTVTDANRTNQLSQESFGQFGQTKQGDFVVVDLRFTNNGDEPATLTTNSLTLLDGNDRESRPDTDVFGYIDPQRNIFLEQVNPGVTREGTAIFSVAPDASDFTLRVGDARVLRNEEAYVNLGF